MLEIQFYSFNLDYKLRVKIGTLKAEEKQPNK
jgi:hypothetical protein